MTTISTLSACSLGKNRTTTVVSSGTTATVVTVFCAGVPVETAAIVAGVVGGVLGVNGVVVGGGILGGPKVDLGKLPYPPGTNIVNLPPNVPPIIDNPWIDEPLTGPGTGGGPVDAPAPPPVDTGKPPVDVGNPDVPPPGTGNVPPAVPGNGNDNGKPPPSSDHGGGNSDSGSGSTPGSGIITVEDPVQLIKHVVDDGVFDVIEVIEDSTDLGKITAGNDVIKKIKDIVDTAGGIEKIVEGGEEVVDGTMNLIGGVLDGFLGGHHADPHDPGHQKTDEEREKKKEEGRRKKEAKEAEEKKQKEERQKKKKEEEQKRKQEKEEKRKQEKEQRRKQEEAERQKQEEEDRRKQEEEAEKKRQKEEAQLPKVSLMAAQKWLHGPQRVGDANPYTPLKAELQKVRNKSFRQTKQIAELTEQEARWIKMDQIFSEMEDIRTKAEFAIQKGQDDVVAIQRIALQDRVGVMDKLESEVVRQNTKYFRTDGSVPTKEQLASPGTEANFDATMSGSAPSPSPGPGAPDQGNGGHEITMTAVMTVTSTPVVTVTQLAISTLRTSSRPSATPGPPEAKCLGIDVHRNHEVYFQIFGIRNWAQSPLPYASPTYPGESTVRLEAWLDNILNGHLKHFWFGEDVETGEPFALVKVQNTPGGSIEKAIRLAGGPRMKCKNSSVDKRLQDLAATHLGGFANFQGDGMQQRNLGKACVGEYGNGICFRPKM